MVKKTYDGLKKKYKDLPDFKILDFEFEISTLEKTDFLLRQIRKQMDQRLLALQNVLSVVLQPWVMGRVARLATARPTIPRPRLKFSCKQDSFIVGSSYVIDVKVGP